MLDFNTMPRKTLAAWISGCHASREYGSEFEIACRAWNDRAFGPLSQRHIAATLAPPFVDVWYEDGIKLQRAIRVY